MNRKLRDLWVADLRAHPELQGHGRLCTANDKFCCLGRLLEVASEAGLMPEGTDWNGRTFTYPPRSPANRTSAWAVAGYFGLDKENPKPEDPSKTLEDYLITLNDTFNWSFASIADWIEGNVPVED